MPVDPQVKQVLELMEQMQIPELSSMQVADARALLSSFKDLAGPGEEVAKVEDRAIPGPAGELSVRVYTPEGADPHPGLVWFHGGGWVLGSIETHDGTCRALANRSGAVVVSVEYRLAPEDPFPAAVDDCDAAVRWVAENGAELGIDTARLAVGGDSAGGNLAAVVCLLARDRGGPALAYQLLVYPATDAHLSAASIAENATGYFLTEADMEWFYGLYGGDADDWRLSPLLADDVRGVPPALVITAEFDPLRDEGEAFAARLREAGVAAAASRYDGMIHGFFGMTSTVDAAVKAVDEAGTALRGALGR